MISCCRGAGGDGVPEYIVVTILVAASGKLELPKVTNQDQLVKALNKLAAIREEQVRQSQSPCCAHFCKGCCLGHFVLSVRTVKCHCVSSHGCLCQLG